MTLALHEDHRSSFLPTAEPALVYLTTDEADARTEMALAPKPSVLTTAPDGTFAVWHLRRGR